MGMVMGDLKIVQADNIRIFYKYTDETLNSDTSLSKLWRHVFLWTIINFLAWTGPIKLEKAIFYEHFIGNCFNLSWFGKDFISFYAAIIKWKVTYPGGVLMGSDE